MPITMQCHNLMCFSARETRSLNPIYALIDGGELSGAESGILRSKHFNFGKSFSHFCIRSIIAPDFLPTSGQSNFLPLFILTFPHFSSAKPGKWTCTQIRDVETRFAPRNFYFNPISFSCHLQSFLPLTFSSFTISNFERKEQHFIKL